MSKSGSALAPWLLATVLLGVSVILIAPWGDYPVNDDWQYARVARNLASTGRLRVDVDIAPTLVGQVLMVWPLIRWLGFSHVLLRVATLGMSVVVIWAIDALLGLARVGRRLRLLALTLLVINPLFVNLACSFMTEPWGYAPALAGAVLWFRSRRAADAGSAPSAVSPAAAVAAGALVGAAFWTRQYCVVVFPALVFATLARIAFDRRWSRLARSLPALAGGAAALAALVSAYFALAQYSGELGRSFAPPVAELAWFDPAVWLVALGLQLIYLTAFFLPLLATWPRERERPLRTGACCALALGLGLGAYALIRLFAPDEAGSFGLHRVFPFASNVIHNGGVGPVTLPDVLLWNQHPYRVFSRGVWRAVGLALVGATALWGLPCRSLRRIPALPGAAGEVALFGAAFAVASLVAFVQASGAASYDRYGLPVMLGTGLCLAILYACPQGARESRALGAGRIAAFGALAAPLGYFTLAGVHDYFRWNDARWRLVERARELGVPTTSIDGGYEVNGWLSFDALRSGHGEEGCIGPCRCDVPPELTRLWNCGDDSYRVATAVPASRDELARERPRYWLPDGPTLYLSRRRPPPPRP
jgi:hypothetical protein